MIDDDAHDCRLRRSACNVLEKIPACMSWDFFQNQPAGFFSKPTTSGSHCLSKQHGVVLPLCFVLPPNGKSCFVFACCVTCRACEAARCSLGLRPFWPKCLPTTPPPAGGVARCPTVSRGVPGVPRCPVVSRGVPRCPNDVSTNRISMMRQVSMMFR